jgi:hypothetical protein
MVAEVGIPQAGLRFADILGRDFQLRHGNSFIGGEPI